MGISPLVQSVGSAPMGTLVQSGGSAPNPPKRPSLLWQSALLCHRRDTLFCGKARCFATEETESKFESTVEFGDTHTLGLLVDFSSKNHPKSTETTYSMHLVTFGWIFHPKIDAEVHENVYQHVFGDFCIKFSSKNRSEIHRNHTLYAFGDFWMDFSSISDARSARKRLPVCIW